MQQLACASSLKHIMLAVFTFFLKLPTGLKYDQKMKTLAKVAYVQHQYPRFF